MHARRSQTRAGFYIYSTPARRRACWCGCARANRRRKKLSSLSYWRLWAPQTVKVVRRASVDARLRARARRSVGWLAGCGTRACRSICERARAVAARGGRSRVGREVGARVRGRTAARWGFLSTGTGSCPCARAERPRVSAYASGGALRRRARGLSGAPTRALFRPLEPETHEAARTSANS